MVPVGYPPDIRLSPLPYFHTRDFAVKTQVNLCSFFHHLESCQGDTVWSNPNHTNPVPKAAPIIRDLRSTDDGDPELPTELSPFVCMNLRSHRAGRRVRCTRAPPSRAIFDFAAGFSPSGRLPTPRPPSRWKGEAKGFAALIASGKPLPLSMLGEKKGQHVSRTTFFGAAFRPHA